MGHDVEVPPGKWSGYFNDPVHVSDTPWGAGTFVAAPKSYFGHTDPPQIRAVRRGAFLDIGTKCKFCLKPFPESDLSEHVTVCVQRKVDCYFGCGVDLMTPDELGQHLQNCPNYYTVCGLCTKSVLRANYHKHAEFHRQMADYSANTQFNRCPCYSNLCKFVVPGDKQNGITPWLVEGRTEIAVHLEDGCYEIADPRCTCWGYGPITAEDVKKKQAALGAVLPEQERGPPPIDPSTCITRSNGFVCLDGRPVQ